MNKVILLGNIGKEIAHRKAGEHDVYEFSLATDKVIKKEKETQWHRCTAWNKTGKFINDFFKTGDSILIEGEIKYEQYEKDNETKYVTKIIIDRAHFVGGKKSDSTNKTESKKQPEDSGGW